MHFKKRIFLVMSTILVVILAGSLGYYLLYGGKYPFTACVYMTVISLTTVGYGEVLPVTGNVTAEMFTMFLIVSGMGILVYGVSMITALFVEGDLSGILRKRKMEKEINRLTGHYIVCGGGETGRHILVELDCNMERTVLVDQDQENIDRCREEIPALCYIKGDATDDQNLVAAGIDRAKGIIICLPSDKDTLFVTMTARMRNRNIRIISKMVDPKMAPKLHNAGANGVVSPNFIGALRMASEMIRPTAVDFLDQMLRSKKGNLRIHEIVIPEGSHAIGKTLEALKIDRYGIVVLGSRVKGREIEFNPPPSTRLSRHMAIVVMGDARDIAAARDSL